MGERPHAGEVLKRLRRFAAQHLGSLTRRGYSILFEAEDGGMDQAGLVLAGELLQVIVVQDRGPIHISLRPASDPEHDIAIETVQRLVEPGVSDQYPSSLVHARWLEDNLLRVELLFSPEHLSETIRRLEDLENDRAAQRYGPVLQPPSALKERLDQIARLRDQPPHE